MATNKLQAYLEVLRAAAGDRQLLGPQLAPEATILVFPGQLRIPGLRTLVEADAAAKKERGLVK
jgi:hypothetical protein